MKKTYILGGLAIVLLVVIVGLTRGGPEVEAETIAKGTIVRSIEENAIIRPVEEYKIESHQNGRVVQVLVEAGDRVEKGDIIVQLENLELNSQINAAQSNLEGTKAEYNAALIALDTILMEIELAQKDLERKKQLLGAGALSQAEFEAAQAALRRLTDARVHQESYIKTIEAQVSSQEKTLIDLRELRQQLAITSPVQGIVLSLPLKAGQMAFPGSLLAEIGVPKSLEAVVDILSDEIGEIRTGQKAVITSPVLGEKQVTGKVQKIYPQATEKVSALGVTQRRVTVIVSLDETANLQPGYEVRVSIETGTKSNVLVLPREAVFLDEEGAYNVMTVENHRVVYREVELGFRNQEYYEVISGLQAGDRVIRDGANQIEENTKVKLVN